MIKALYVDDETNLLELTKIFLERDPRIEVVVTTDSPQEALREASAGNVDIIVSDYDMPTMDGLDLLKAIRSEGNDIPFILFTGRGRESVVVEAINNGVDFYIQKGGDPRSQFAELLHKMHKAVDRWRSDQEVMGFYEIVKAMDTSLLIMAVEGDGLQEATIQQSNPAAQSLLKEFGLTGAKTLKELREGGLAGLYDVMQTFTSSSSDKPDSHFTEVEVTASDGSVRYLDTDLAILPGGRMGVTIIDITKRVLAERRSDELSTRATKQRQAAFDLITDEVIARAVIPDAYERISKAAIQGLGADKVTIWLKQYGEMVCVHSHIDPAAEAFLFSEVSECDSEFLDTLATEKTFTLDASTGGFGDGSNPSISPPCCVDSSSINAAIMADGEMKGFICAESLEDKVWQRDEEFFLSNIATVTGQMLMAHQREEVKKDLSHSHMLLGYIVENAQASIAVHDKDLNYLYVSRKYIDHYGLQDHEIIGRHHYEVFPDLPQKWRDVHQRVLKGAREFGDMDSYMRDDGTLNWTRWECVPWYERDGSIGGLIVYTEVIDKWVEDQERLQSNEMLLRKITENLWDNVAVLDMDLNITFVSNSISEMRGISPEETIRTYVGDIMPPESLSKINDMMHEAERMEEEGSLDPEKVWEFEIDMYHALGHIIKAQIKACFLRDKDMKPTGILTIARIN